MEARSQLRHRPIPKGMILRICVSLLYSPPAFGESQTAVPMDFEKAAKISILAQTESTMINLNFTRTFLLALSLTPATLSAQAVPSNPSPAPVPYASLSQLNSLLGQLEQNSATAQADLAKVRVEKWKADASHKKLVQANIESIQRNLKFALPEITAQLRNSPEDLAATFKLYRNLDALYSVMSNVAESAGAFGSKDEFQSLSNDISAFERSRMGFADRLENLASSKEAELTQLRGQLKALQASPPPPPKKVVVDDTEPPKKPVKKKKTTPSTVTTKPPSQTPTSPPPPNQ
jgi:hypothetical protein